MRPIGFTNNKSLHWKNNLPK